MCVQRVNGLCRKNEKKKNHTKQNHRKTAIRVKAYGGRRASFKLISLRSAFWLSALDGYADCICFLLSHAYARPGVCCLLPFPSVGNGVIE